MTCFFEDRCSNADIECDYCQYNPDACTKDYFDWNVEANRIAKLGATL